MKKTYIFALSLLLPCAAMAMKRSKSFFPTRKNNKPTLKSPLKRSKSFPQLRKIEESLESFHSGIICTSLLKLKKSKDSQTNGEKPKEYDRWCFCSENLNEQLVFVLVRCTQNKFRRIKHKLRITVPEKGGSCTAVMIPSPYVLPFNTNCLDSKEKKLLFSKKLVGYDGDALEAIRLAWKEEKENEKKRKCGEFEKGIRKVVYVEKGMAAARLKEKFDNERVVSRDDFPYRNIESVEIITADLKPSQ